MELERTREKVAIIGCSACKTAAPTGDDSWEFWGVNNLFLHMPDVKWTKWFEIHSIKQDAGHWWRRDLVKKHGFIWSRDFRGQDVDAYVKGLASLPCPVIMQQQWPEVPNSVAYPLAAVVEKFGNYFTNTVSYEIALAILMGYKEIGIYGVDMAVGSEYQDQRPSCEYFIGIARGLGIKVTIPAEADLLKTRFMYAFQDKEITEWDKKVRLIESSVDRQMAEAQQQMQAANERLAQGRGAKMAIAEMNKIWGNL